MKWPSVRTAALRRMREPCTAWCDGDFKFSPNTWEGRDVPVERGMARDQVRFDSVSSEEVQEYFQEERLHAVNMFGASNEEYRHTTGAA